MRLIRTLAGLSLVIFLGASLPESISACLICQDRIRPEEEALEALIEEKGPAAIEELREILQCRRSQDLGLKAIAARALGRFKDRQSIPEFRRIIMELIDRESSGRFGTWSSGHILRQAAAEALGRMGEGGVGEKLWEVWESLPEPRQEELPRLLSDLETPDAQGKQLVMLRRSPFPSVLMAVVVELRRTGDSRAVPLLEAKLEEWRKASAGETDLAKKVFFSRMLRYTEGTIRVLKKR